MSLDEFSLIEKYFSQQANRQDTPHRVLGIGDDAAIMAIPPGHQLAVTIDTLIAGKHFPLKTLPQDIGYKSLTVNVSDLLAMGAQPSFFVLSLTLPDNDESFIRGFTEGLFEAAHRFGIALVGGDTCKGPLSISIQASGYVPDNQFIPRSGAQVGDQILVSGPLGNAALGLAALQQKVDLDVDLKQVCISALNRPKPKLELLPLLQKYATACIDVSDGLVADLRHILEKSSVGATINKDNLPVNDWVREHDRFEFALSGGDDYEILFTTQPDKVPELLQAANAQDLELYSIGKITLQDYQLESPNGLIYLNQTRGFDHFAS